MATDPTPELSEAPDYETMVNDALCDAEESAATARFLARAVLRGSDDIVTIARELMTQDRLRLGAPLDAPGGPFVGKSWPARLVATAFVEAMQRPEGGLLNNLAFDVCNERGLRLRVSVQRADGETPEQQRAKAQDRARDLVRALDRLAYAALEAARGTPAEEAVERAVRAALETAPPPPAAGANPVVAAAAHAVDADHAARFARDLDQHFARKGCGG
jgi:hypothetical protein